MGFTPQYVFDVPPFACSPLDQQRIDEQRRRRRLLYGGWIIDARARQRARLGSDVADNQGDPELSCNPAVQCWTSQAILYTEAPEIGNTLDPSAAEDMTEFTRKAGLWPMMQRYQRDTDAFREMLLRVDVSRVSTTGDPTRDLVARYRPVFPDLCELLPDPSQPDRPIEITEFRQRPDASGTPRWTKERWSIATPGLPIHAVSDGVGDVSDQCGLPKAGAMGDAYPTLCRRTDGRPVLPYVLHHAARTGQLLDPFCGIELVEGTLEIVVDWSFFSAGLLTSAYGRIVAIGCAPIELTTKDGRQVSVTAPNVVHRFERTEDFGAGQPDVRMLATTFDALSTAQAIMLKERKLYTFAGIDGTDLQRAGEDPRSGFALALSQEGKRQAALKSAPVMELGDAETLALTAIMLNRHLGAEVYPEEGWTLEYAPLAVAGAADAPVTPAGTTAPVDVQATALNGAQSAAMDAILDAVREGRRDKSVAVAQLQFVFKMTVDEAKALVEPITVVAATPAAPPPGQPAAGAPPEPPEPPDPEDPKEEDA